MDHAHAHALPTEGRELTNLSVSATFHCLTGCALGEITGLAIGTALGFSNAGTIVLAVALAFLFGYSLTSLPLLRSGMALTAVIPIALAADTFSIATMEVIDNLIMVVIPGAMDAGLDNILFWGALSFALAVAAVFAFPVNRWLLKRGKGHAAVHKTGVHGGPPVRLVAAITLAAFVFGSTVLVATAFDDDRETGHGDNHSMVLGPRSGSTNVAATSFRSTTFRGSEIPITFTRNTSNKLGRAN